MIWDLSVAGLSSRRGDAEVDDDDAALAISIMSQTIHAVHLYPVDVEIAPDVTQFQIDHVILISWMHVTRTISPVWGFPDKASISRLYRTFGMEEA